MSDVIHPGRSTPPPPAMASIGLRAGRAAHTGLMEARRCLSLDLKGLSFHKQTHVGDPGHPADAIVHQAVARSLSHQFSWIAVAGEEADQEMFLRVGDLVALVDPIDGTASARAMMSNFATVVMIYQVSADLSLEIVSVAIATASCFLTIFDEDGTVSSQNLMDRDHNSPATYTEGYYAGPRQDPDAQAVCVVAAKPSSRRDLDRVQTAAGSRPVFNLGGTPSVDGLLRAELGASVRLRPSTPWDAADIPIAVHAGLHALRLDIGGSDAVVTPERVKELFRNPIFGIDDAAAKKTIPPIVVGPDPDFVFDLATRLRQPGSGLLNGHA